MKHITTLLMFIAAAATMYGASFSASAGKAAHVIHDNGVVDSGNPSGVCGDNVRWEIEDGVLTISGSGDMWDFTDAEQADFAGYQQMISSVMIGDSVTYVGNYTFVAFMSMSEITILGEVRSIGQNAFYYCNALSTITCWSVTPPAIAGTMVFYAVPATVNIYVPAPSVEAYQAAQGWSSFRNIQPIPGTEEKNVVTVFGREVVIDSTTVDEEVDIFGDSTLVYNPEDNTLTFSSLNLEVGDSMSTAISYSGTEPLTIVLCDSSVIYADTVIASTADIVIRGEGTLIAEGVTPIVGAPTASITFDSVSMYVRSVPSPAALRRRIRGIKQTDEDGGPALSGFASADFNKTTVTPPEAEYGDVEETDEVLGITVTYKALYVSHADGSKSVLKEFRLTPVADGINALESPSACAVLDPSQPMYNILGMPVEEGYKGVVVQNGRKFVVL